MREDINANEDQDNDYQYENRSKNHRANTLKSSNGGNGPNVSGSVIRG